MTTTQRDHLGTNGVHPASQPKLCILCSLSIYNMRPFADFVNATMSFRAALLDRRPCPIWRKYFFRKILPAQWICYGEASKRGFLYEHSTAIKAAATGLRQPLQRVSRGRKSWHLTILRTVCDSVRDVRIRTVFGRNRRGGRGRAATTTAGQLQTDRRTPR
jgi:hypothetical protein